MKLEKLKSGVMIFVGICILLAGISISGGLGNVADSINQIDAQSDQSYELVVRDGFIYISDTVNGQVWKKADVPEGKWEEIDHFFND
ncbi:hypothetical protein [Sporosarcina sp. 6E9]|uniref:hypothetical protein n=1 Tax=Sporosarcina sp. 6E9 TaxID=2819235 RepID=UPI001B315F13|nr:hypothetical protein [Sporosarcina sp. 6E9]